MGTIVRSGSGLGAVVATGRAPAFGRIAVARDAASIVLMRKDLGVLADGVTEGRRIFANTTKYVLMATSSNFGNMFSLVGASLIVPFPPLLPKQVLLNNLLYDDSQTTIPTDNVDDEQPRRPAHWDIGFIRRFATVFGRSARSSNSPPSRS